jgi:outer membrane receptor protein involved in Fe transport
MKVIFPFLLLFLLIDSAFADQVTGRLINNKTGEPITFAQVFVQEGESILGTVSNDDGFFTLKSSGVIEGPLMIQSIETGKVSYGKISTSAQKSLILGDILLEVKVTDLARVEVRGDIGVTQIEPQKITYATENLISQIGGTAGDILKLMPSVAMGGSPNHNRDIRFRGLGNGYTLVLINGRNVGVNGNNRETVLDMIPASQIESIEILSQPGADVQADGMNGVVNIILKKNAQLGTSGSAFVSIDRLGGYDANISLNQKSGPLQVMASFEKLRRSADKTELGFQRKFDKSGNLLEIIPIDKIENKQFDNTMGRVNLGYQSGKQWFIEGEYLVGKQSEDKSKIENNKTLDPSGNFKKGTIREEDELKDLIFHNAFLRTKKTWENGMQMDFGLNSNIGSESKFKTREDFTMLPDGQVDESKASKVQRESESISFSNYNPYFNFSKKVNNYLSLKTGYQGFIISRESDRLIEDYKANENTWVVNGTNRNNFFVQENTHGVFMVSDYIRNNWKVTLGYRQEMTSLTSQSITDTVFNGGSSYFIALPNAKAIYTLSENQYLTASIGRRVRRPGFQDLNPFTEIKDITEIKQGNPNLQPELAWAYELGYFKQIKWLNVGANVFYRDITNLIQKNFSTLEDGTIVERPENLSAAYTYGYELLLGMKPTSWWNINLNYSNFESQIRAAGSFEGDAIKDQFEWTAKAISDMQLPWKMSLQLSANFVGPKASSQETETKLWFADFGLTKTVAENGMAILRVTDVFDTISKVRTKDTGTVLEEKREDTPGQIVSLGFKWNF